MTDNAMKSSRLNSNVNALVVVINPTHVFVRVCDSPCRCCFVAQAHNRINIHATPKDPTKATNTANNSMCFFTKVAQRANQVADNPVSTRPLESMHIELDLVSDIMVGYSRVFRCWVVDIFKDWLLGPVAGCTRSGPATQEIPVESRSECRWSMPIVPGTATMVPGTDGGSQQTNQDSFLSCSCEYRDSRTNTFSRSLSHHTWWINVTWCSTGTTGILYRYESYALLPVPGVLYWLCMLIAEQVKNRTISNAIKKKGTTNVMILLFWVSIVTTGTWMLVYPVPGTVNT